MIVLIVQEKRTLSILLIEIFPDTLEGRKQSRERFIALVAADLKDTEDLVYEDQAKERATDWLSTCDDSIYDSGDNLIVLAKRPVTETG